jgi:hypothetical protein
MTTILYKVHYRSTQVSSWYMDMDQEKFDELQTTGSWGGGRSENLGGSTKFVCNQF